MKTRLFLLLVVLWLVGGVAAYIKIKPLHEFKLPAKPVVQIDTVPKGCDDADLRNYVDTVLRGIVMYPRFAVRVDGQTYTYKLIDTTTTGDKK